MDLSHRQWRAAAVFKGGSGDFREIQFPWGALPWLRLGQRLMGGEIIPDQEFQIIVSNHAVTLCDAAVIPSWLYSLRHPANLSEKCLVMGGVKTTVIILVIECVRALMATNRALTYGLLEPNYLERIIERMEIEDEVLYLGFSNQFPKSSLTDSVVVLITRLLYDASFRTAWRTVYHERFSASQTSTWECAIPLATVLP